MLPEFLKPNSQRVVWLTASIVAVLCLVWFGSTVEWSLLAGLVRQAGWPAFLAALFLSTVNGLLAVLWLVVVCRRPGAARGAFQVVSWQMLAASILPARLSDLAWMYFMHRWLALKASRAIFVALYHRLLDFIVVCFLVLTAILAANLDLTGGHIGVVAAVLLLFFSIVVTSLTHILSLGATVLIWLHRRLQHRVTRSLLAQLLHVRIWYRHGLPKSLLWFALAIIVGRWLAIFGAFTILIHAMAPVLDFRDSLLATAIYVFFGIVPLQTFGGFGAGEAGLAWILTLYGIGIGTASTISLLCRLALNIMHVGFWLIIVSVLRINDSWRAKCDRS